MFHAPSTAPFYPVLNKYLSARLTEFDQVTDERRAVLAQAAEYIRVCEQQRRSANLVFVCTHNSRRSHLSQVWSQIAAFVYQWPHVATYSGGTEATAFNPRAIATLQRAGLRISCDDPANKNPIYRVEASAHFPVLTCFSKRYDAPENPQSDFCAVLNCAEADEACPLIRGSHLRIPIRYEDPKVADNTDQEAARYDERSQQICREMLLMMSLV